MKKNLKRNYALTIGLIYSLLFGLYIVAGCTVEKDKPAGSVAATCLSDGTCDPGLVCVDNTCRAKPEVPDPLAECTPSCKLDNGQAALCGPDGCGGNCGECRGQQLCISGQCACQPQCDGLACGEDGCGGTCGKCDKGLACLAGQCICEPDCKGLECGDNGCGGSCGQCGWPAECLEGSCECEPDCEGAECGDDGCGGTCGTCKEGWFCEDWLCWELCKPDCTDIECGNDGCDGSCGTCEGETPFCMAGQCVADCTPECGQSECGNDGCGGSCGECGLDELCEEGLCVLDSLCGYCPEGTECGYFEVPDETLCGGDGCAEGLDFVGECGDDGNTLVWCDDGTTIAIDCDFFEPDSICAWSDEDGFFNCINEMQ
jgi:hypothetical protein